MNVVGYVDLVDQFLIGKETRSCVVGWARNVDSPDARPILEIVIDDIVVGLSVGTMYRQDLLSNELEDGKYGFRYPIPRDLIDDLSHRVSVRVLGSEKWLTGSVAFKLTPEPSKVALCAIVKNEQAYLLEWIAHHVAVGVDHFFLYDNESEDDTPYLMTELQRSGLVTYVHWESHNRPNPQTEAYNSCVPLVAGRFSWMGFLDIDEYFNPLALGSLKCVLALHRGADAVAFNWRVFGSGGAVVFENRPVTERFVYRAQDGFASNCFFKTFARPSSIERVHVHQVSLEKGIYVTSGGLPVDPGKGTTTTPDYTTACINHYFGKSREEWDKKRSRGMADKPSVSKNRVRPESDFLDHDRNEISDLSISSLQPAVRRELEKLRDLGPYCDNHCPVY